MHNRLMEWKAIDSAPKEGDLILLFGGRYVTVGNWDNQASHKKPRPYWRSERGFLFGTNWDRENQPTHWMEIPSPPKQTNQT